MLKAQDFCDKYRLAPSYGERILYTYQSKTNMSYIKSQEKN